MSRLPGTSLLSSFDRQVAEHNREVDETDRLIASFEGEIAFANKQREEAYVQLAELYCDDREKFERELSAVSREVQGYFDEKAKRRAAVVEDIVRCRQVISQASQDLSDAQTARDLAAKERDAIAAKVNAALAVDAGFQELVRDRETLSTRLETEKKNREALEMECSGKRVPYEAHPIFRYLLGQKYGTDEYKGKGTTARMDGWLATKVAWSDNYPNYCLLVQLPGFAATRVSEVERAIEVISARIKLRAQEADQAHGLDDAKLRYDRRVHGVEELERRLVDLDKQAQTFSEERNALEVNRDPFVMKAKAAIKSMLCGESIRELRGRAERTQDPRDNELVSRIENAETTVNNGRFKIKQLRLQRDQAETKRQRIQTARKKFASDYTGTYDRFDTSVNLDDLLTGYLLGQTSDHTFWGHIQRHHHDETPQPSYSSSSWDSSSSGSSWGGGDSGGGASFGGGDSGGGSSFGGGD